jgi:hypothetical protein
MCASDSIFAERLRRDCRRAASARGLSAFRSFATELRVPRRVPLLRQVHLVDTGLNLILDRRPEDAAIAERVASLQPVHATQGLPDAGRVGPLGNALAGTWSSGIREIHRVSESFEQHARTEPTGPPSRAARSDQGTTQPLRHTGAEPETGWAGRSDLFRQM